MNVGSRYVWWPAYQPNTIDLADPRNTAGHLAGIAVFTFLLCLPAVTRATGISAPAVLAMIGVHVVWYVLASHVISRGVPSKLRANVLLAGNLVANTGVAVAIPVLTHDGRTPLWMLPVVYACLNGALQERERCIGFLGVHALSPLVALPLVVGQDITEWSIAAPVLCAVLCATGYNHLASTSARWRDVRAEQNAALALLRTRVATRNRARLMGDLDDSIGSALGVVGVYGQLIEQHISRPDELRAIAAMVRDAARGGLGELRGVIGAMDPAAADVDALAATLTRAGGRAAEGTQLEVAVSIVEGGSIRIEAPLRLAVVRAFQDAIRHSRRDPEARRIDARLGANATTLVLEITNDAARSANDPPRDEQMSARILELGGRFSRRPEPTSGTIVRVSLPRSS